MPHMITMAEILRGVSRRHGCTQDLILGQSRAHWVVVARQEAMSLMVAEGRWSLPRIGMFMGRDHSTVIHGDRAHKARMAELSTGSVHSLSASVHRTNTVQIDTSSTDRETLSA
jgi:chromosomal replication initiation ATPase DnaA